MSQGERVDELILPAVVESVSRARHQIAAMADALGVEASGDLELVTSELTANAVKDSQGEIRLRLTRGDAVLRVEVDDDSPGQPTLTTTSEVGGWGLRLVDKVSTAWGVIPLPDGGKTVWAEVPIGPPENRQSTPRDPTAVPHMPPEWFRDALDAMLDLVAVHRAVRDEDGRIVDFEILYINPVNIEIEGRTQEDMIGARLSALYSPEDSDGFISLYASVVETGESALTEEMHISARAGAAPADRYYTFSVTRFGEGVLVVARDVTEPRRARRGLEDTNRKFEAAQELAHIGVWGIDFESGVASASDELGRIFGFEQGGDVPWHPGMVFDAIHPDDQADVQDAIAAAPGNDGKLSTEARVVRPDGDVRIVAVHARITYFDEGGQPSGVWGTAQDVTAQREAEHALLATSTELAREQTIVDQLQRAILPHLPVVEGCEVAARYLPAGTGAQVGGDWYDLFLVGDRLVFSIGDVAGHGLEAASLMAQLRNALRGAAYCGASVSESLAAVDRLVADQAGDEFATCIFGTLALGSRHLEWANAGHPPLLMVAPGADPTYLASADQPPLGVGAQAGAINELDLGPGSLVVAYTDGLIEQPSESLDVGLARLSGLVHHHRGEPTEVLCESLGLAMFAERDRRDDVCILALRIEP